MRRAFRWLLGGAVVGAVVLVIALSFRDELYRRQAKLPPFTHEAGGSSEVMVAMRDGVKLHTEVFRPAGAAPAPTILVRNPYIPLRALERLHCRLLTRYGYACVLQDVRGQLDSEGNWSPIIHERDDGVDTLQWLVKQPFMNGNIAMRGPSYLTCTQLVIADVLPPEVKTLVPSVFGVDLRLATYERGLFHPDFVTAWATMMPDRGMRLTAGSDYLKAASHRPAIEADEKYMTKRLDWYRDLISADEPSSPYWNTAQQVEFRAIPGRAKVPMLFVAGFFDVFFAAQLDVWARLATREQSVMVIGPWNHLNMTSGDATLRVETGRLDPWPLMLEWFDHHLKGKPLTTLVPGTVHTLGPGDEAWRTHTTWPDVQKTHTLHLGNANAAQSCEGGALTTSVSAPSDITYRFDPENPAPSLGGASMLSFAFYRHLSIVPGPVDQGRSCERDDVLTFKAAPLEKDLRLSGSASLKLTVSSTAPDTAFIARLISEEDGKALLIREAAATLAFPDESTQHRRTYEPGSPTSLDINFWPIEWVLPKGARLRIDITSSSFPVYQTHSNRAGPWATQTGVDVATQTIRVGHGDSILTLPVAPP